MTIHGIAVMIYKGENAFGDIDIPNLATLRFG